MMADIILYESNSTLSVLRSKLRMAAADSLLQRNWLRCLVAILTVTLAVSFI